MFVSSTKFPSAQFYYCKVNIHPQTLNLISSSRKYLTVFIIRSFIFFLLCMNMIVCMAQPFGPFPSVKTGAEQTEKYFPLLKDKRIALVVNATSFIGNVHLVDTLISSGMQVKEIFAPEHGFRGDADAGQEIESSIDLKTKLPVISLYGNHKKPTHDDLKNIDLVVYDIQDVGVRFFTYISTLQYVMEACAMDNIQLLILDRPDPNGWYIDGPILEKKFSSFVGMQPIPVVYAMTPGEYAQMLNGEKLLSDSLQCDLKIISCEGYDHNTKYILPRKPSPNLPNMTAVYLYPSVCFFEGTPVSLGRGTDKPFQLLGYPGCKLGKIMFTPTSRAGATNPPYLNELCTGFDLSVYNNGFFFSQKSLFLSWLVEMYQTYPDRPNFFTSYFDTLAGTESLKNGIMTGKTVLQFRNDWKPGLEKFNSVRKKYLLYKDFD